MVDAHQATIDSHYHCSHRKACYNEATAAACAWVGVGARKLTTSASRDLSRGFWGSFLEAGDVDVAWSCPNVA